MRNIVPNIVRTGGVAVLVAAKLLVSGCASWSNSNSVYTSGQAQREQTVRYGVVEGVREVLIQGGQTGAGTLAGGALGDRGGQHHRRRQRRDCGEACWAR